MYKLTVKSSSKLTYDNFFLVNFIAQCQVKVVAFIGL